VLLEKHNPNLSFLPRVLLLTTVTTTPLSFVPPARLQRRLHQTALHDAATPTAAIHVGFTLFLRELVCLRSVSLSLSIGTSTRIGLGVAGDTRAVAARLSSVF